MSLSFGHDALFIVPTKAMRIESQTEKYHTNPKNDCEEACERELESLVFAPNILRQAALVHILACYYHHSLRVCRHGK